MTIKVWSNTNLQHVYETGHSFEFLPRIPTTTYASGRALNVYDKENNLLAVWMPYTFSRVEVHNEVQQKCDCMACKAFKDSVVNVTIRV